MATTHHCKLTSWRPSTITSLSTHPDKHFLAVGREDSTIEIHVVEDVTVSLLYVLGGLKFDGKVLKTIWKQFKDSNRLISVTENHIYQWDIDTMTQIQSLSSYGGDIIDVCLSNNKEMLAVASSNMMVHLYRFDDDDGLVEFSKSFPKLTEGSLSRIAWSVDDRFIYAGTDSDLVGYSLETMEQAFSTHSSDITAIHVLDRDNLVCGHAGGHITLHELKYGTQVAEIKQHIAAIRCIVGTGENSIIVSGEDPTIVRYSRDENQRWYLDGLMRIHTHDVLAMTYTKDFLFTGGVDTTLQLTNCTNFGSKSEVYKFKSQPHASWVSVGSFVNVSLSDKSESVENYMLEASRSSLSIWRLGTADEYKISDINGIHLNVRSEISKIIQFDIKDKEYIRAVSMSPDATHFAYCNSRATKVYRFDPEALKVSRVKVLEGGDLIQFCHNSKNLIIVNSQSIVNYSLDTDTQNSIQIEQPKDSKSTKPSAIISMAISHPENTKSLESQYIALMDSNNTLSVFSLKAMKLIVSLPSESYCSVLHFSNENDLLIAGTKQVIVYSIKELKHLRILSYQGQFLTNKVCQVNTMKNAVYIWNGCPRVYKITKNSNNITNITMPNQIYAANFTKDKQLVINSLQYEEQVFPQLPPAIRLKVFGRN